MTEFLIRKFIKNHENIENPIVRDNYIIFSGTLGLVINIFLFALKLIIGLIMSSIAIVSDSFNNLSDCLTSLVAIFGSKLSSKPADDEHPHGHGRFEYVASLVVAIIIIIVGLELFRSSIIRIFNPEEVAFKLSLIIILIASTLLKVYMYSYNKYIGKKINSTINMGLAQDSINDVFATLGVIFSSIVSYMTGYNIDGFAGLVVSILVMKSGFDLGKETVDLILGEIPDKSLYDKIEKIILSGKYVRGYHDLSIHDYGRGKILATAHAEIPKNLSVVSVHRIIDSLEKKAKDELGIDLVIHMDPTYCLRRDEIIETKIFKINDENMKGVFQRAKNFLLSDQLVAFPTETVYGLGANGLSEDACRKIFKAKNRPVDNPLILHVSSIDEVYKLAEVTEDALKLMENMWPGPMTIILKKKEIIPDIVTAGGDTVAIRMPKNKLARDLIAYVGKPIAAPSANISGRPSPTNAQDVYYDFKGIIPMIIDGGDCKIGIESTVIDLSEKPYSILRPGYYIKEDFEKYVEEVVYDKSIVDKNIVPKSPGQKYKHYAPNAEVFTFVGDNAEKLNDMQKFIDKYKSEGKEVGLLIFDENIDKLQNADEVLSLGSKDGDHEEMARVIFKYLRQMDKYGIDVILIEGVYEKGLGIGIMNRLKKSSNGRVKYY